MTARQIMIVRGEAADEWLVDALREHGFEVSAATTPTAFERLLLSPPDLLVIDVLDPRAGIELLRSVRSALELKTTLVLVIASAGVASNTVTIAVQ